MDKNNMSKSSNKRFPPSKKFNRPIAEGSSAEVPGINRRARLVVRNVPYTLTDTELTNHFSKYGPLEEVKILYRPDGKLVGCAFVQFKLINDAAKAVIQANNKPLLGRKVFVDFAVSKDLYLKNKGTEKSDEAKLSDNVKIKTANSPVCSDQKENTNESTDDESKTNSECSGNSVNTESIVDEKSKLNKIKHDSNDVKKGQTVFIKNIPYAASNDDLNNVCKQFGIVIYALVNRDAVTGRSKGTGFVKFWDKNAADLCLQAGTEFKLMDTVLDPHLALSRTEAHNLGKKPETSAKDSRNLYLLREGLIMANSEAAEGVSKSDILKRMKLEQTKNLMLKNLNRFISRDRLTIHNVPDNWTDAKLRDLIISLVNVKPRECKLMLEKQTSPQHPVGKLKGFGFIAFRKHPDALKCLRSLNNNPKLFTTANRPIVSFSIEDKSVINLKKRRVEKSIQNNPIALKKDTKKKRENKTATDAHNADEPQRKRPKLDRTQSTDHNSTNKFVGNKSKSNESSKPMRSNRKLLKQTESHVKRLKISKKKHKSKLNKPIRTVPTSSVGPCSVSMNIGKLPRLVVSKKNKKTTFVL